MIRFKRGDRVIVCNKQKDSAFAFGGNYPLLRRKGTLLEKSAWYKRDNNEWIIKWDIPQENNGTLIREFMIKKISLEVAGCGK